jgi:hypothetical protein
VWVYVCEWVWECVYICLCGSLWGR